MKPLKALSLQCLRTLALLVSGVVILAVYPWQEIEGQSQKQAQPSAPTPAYKVCSARMPGNFANRLHSREIKQLSGMQKELALLRGYAWSKPELKVAFLGGNGAVHQRIQSTAATWEKYIPVHFNFNSTANQADIRIGFDEKSGSWSFVGTGARGIPLSNATMNFGWLTATTDQTEYDRVVLHEFGHALGAVHEHQSPNATIKWNVPVVLAYYKEHDSWDEDMTRRNVLNAYAPEDVDATTFDPESIMLYAFPPEFTTDGTTFSWNTGLSQRDIEKMQGVYGKAH